jgi:ribosomal protein L34E
MRFDWNKLSSSGVYKSQCARCVRAVHAAARNRNSHIARASFGMQRVAAATSAPVSALLRQHAVCVWMKFFAHRQCGIERA